jgi:hypothetical protein
MAELRTRNDETPLNDVATGKVAKDTGGTMRYGTAWIWILVVLFFVALIWFSVQHGWKMV